MTDAPPPLVNRVGLQAYHTRQGCISAASPRYVPRSLPRLPLLAGGTALHG